MISIISQTSNVDRLEINSSLNFQRFDCIISQGKWGVLIMIVAESFLDFSLAEGAKKSIKYF